MFKKDILIHRDVYRYMYRPLIQQFHRMSFKYKLLAIYMTVYESI